MECQPDPCLVDANLVADILLNIGTLMKVFHDSDVALQHALSDLTAVPEQPVAIPELQHIDLITQTHADLAKLLPVLSASLRATPVSRDDLRNALTLRSLQDRLIEAGSSTNETTAGELSLF